METDNPSVQVALGESLLADFSGLAPWVQSWTATLRILRFAWTDTA